MQHDTKNEAQTTLKLPADLWKAIRLESLERGIPARDIVVEALRAHLGQSKPKNNARKGAA